MAHRRVLDDLMAENVAGKWTGELSASALSTATALSVLGLMVGRVDIDSSENCWMKEQMDGGIRWLLMQQNTDGGWGDTDKSHSNISTTLLAIAALHLTGQTDENSKVIDLAWSYVDSKGRWDGLKKRYGKDKTFAVPIMANCAIAGILPWKQVAALPFELACVPQKFYRFVRMPVVSYAIPALVAIGQAKFFADPPWNPLTRFARKFSVGRSLDVLQKMQPASGGFLEAIPLTCFVSMALIHSGRENHPVVQAGLRFIRESFRQEGSWPIDTNLATWVTTLSVNAVASDSNQDSESFLSQVDLDWVMKCQYKSVHPFTGSAPGGWGWSDLSGAVPDADDTPGALLALKKFHDFGGLNEEKKASLIEASANGVQWLLDLQNRDDGWPTFCRGWGRLPFDRSGSDITAHVLRAIDCWKPILEAGFSDRFPKGKIDQALKQGVKYLTKTQKENGSWDPLWFGNQDRPDEDNPVYGTAKVILALVEIGFQNGNSPQYLTDTSLLEEGLIWLVDQQNISATYPNQGSWGGGESLAGPNQKTNGSVEETALALDALLVAERFAVGQLEMGRDHEKLGRLRKSIARGLNWLNFAVYEGKHQHPWPIGFYFAKLWYYEKLYPILYSTAALSRAREFGWDGRLIEMEGEFEQI